MSTDLIENFNNDSEFLQKLKITTNVFLKTNGFIVDEPDFNKFSSKEFVDWVEKKNSIDSELIRGMEKVKLEVNFRSLLSDVYTERKKPQNKILVFFLSVYGEKTIGIDNIKNIIGLMLLMDCKELLIISPKELSPKSKEYINSNSISEEDNYTITNYTDSNFVNVIDHCFTSEVIKVYKGKELEDFLQKHKININALPRMFTYDPLVKFYRGKSGDVFMLKRKMISGNVLLDNTIVYKRVE
tara:strand:+ start:152 stop:877 length:726 start_codon:yes stop_codon:yes gene_type:complete